MSSREDGYTLVELLVVLMLVAVLAAIAVGFHFKAREQASDATAQANIRVAAPAIEAYHVDNGTYAGMTLAVLQSSYSSGVQGIEILSAEKARYCIRSTVGSSTWYKDGPIGVITETACA